MENFKHKNNSKTIYLLRHGETIGPSKRYLGQRDLPLSSIGLKKARYWKKYFSSKKLDTIYSSDLERTAETARIISFNQNIRVLYLSMLREINLGKWDGISFESIRKNYPRLFYARGMNLEHFRPPNGENFTDLRSRVMFTFKNIVTETKKRSLIVAHAGVNRIIISSVLKIPIKDIFSIKQKYGAMNKLLVEQNSLKLITLNYTPQWLLQSVT